MKQVRLPESGRYSIIDCFFLLQLYQQYQVAIQGRNNRRFSERYWVNISHNIHIVKILLMLFASLIVVNKI